MYLNLKLSVFIFIISKISRLCCKIFLTGGRRDVTEAIWGWEAWVKWCCLRILHNRIGVPLANRSVDQEVLIRQILLMMRNNLLLNVPSLTRSLHVLGAARVQLFALSALETALLADLAIYGCPRLTITVRLRWVPLDAEFANVLIYAWLHQELVGWYGGCHGLRGLDVCDPNRPPKILDPRVSRVSRDLPMLLLIWPRIRHGRVWRDVHNVLLLLVLL